ncbi:MAG: hypothetical protein OHK006_15430 [Thermodesulfovibrionales bacterium]
MDKPLRLCVVSPLYHPSLGGVGRQAVALTERLRAEGAHVIVLCREMRGIDDWKPHRDVPVRTVRSLNPYRVNLQQRSLQNILISFSFSLALGGALFRTRRDYDIVHFHGAGLPLVTNVLLLKLMGKKVVAKVAGAKMAIEAGSFNGRYLGLGKLFVRMLRKVDVFVSISSEIRSDLLGEGYEEARIRDISNFVVPGDFSPPADVLEKTARKRELVKDDRLMLLFAGRLVRTKRVDVLLQAVKRSCDQGLDPVLVILGEGEEREPLERLAAGLGLQGRVVFRGNVQNVREYLHAADIFVFPSEREGMPNALLEAMACGLPVIAARSGGVTDIVSDAENGLLVDAGSVDQFHAALERLLRDPDVRQLLGRRAFETIRERFSIDSVIPRYLALYRELLGAD